MSETREVSEEDRERLWERASLFNRLVVDGHYHRVTDAEEQLGLLNENSVPHNVVGKIVKVISIDWQSLEREQRAKWFAHLPVLQVVCSALADKFPTG